MLLELANMASQVAGQALGGPPPSSTATGGAATTGPNNVTYNKGPSWSVVVGALLVGGVVWWALKRKR